MSPGPEGDTVVKDNGRPNLRFGPPGIDDGILLWQLARDSAALDVNSRYSYLLWCRDFAASSVTVRDGSRLAGFITGFIRPQAPDTLFVWQVAVADSHRRRGLARRMLDHLVTRLAPGGVNYVEATVTPDNTPSTRLFTSFATAHGANLTRDELFSETTLGDGHSAEVLFRIGPLSASPLVGHSGFIADPGMEPLLAPSAPGAAVHGLQLPQADPRKP